MDQLTIGGTNVQQAPTSATKLLGGRLAAEDVEALTTDDGVWIDVTFDWVTQLLREIMNPISRSRVNAAFANLEHIRLRFELDYEDPINENKRIINWTMNLLLRCSEKLRSVYVTVTMDPKVEYTSEMVLAIGFDKRSINFLTEFARQCPRIERFKMQPRSMFECLWIKYARLFPNRDCKLRRVDIMDLDSNNDFACAALDHCDSIEKLHFIENNAEGFSLNLEDIADAFLNYVIKTPVVPLRKVKFYLNDFNTKLLSNLIAALPENCKVRIQIQDSDLTDVLSFLNYIGPERVKHVSFSVYQIHFSHRWKMHQIWSFSGRIHQLSISRSRQWQAPYPFKRFFQKFPNLKTIIFEEFEDMDFKWFRDNLPNVTLGLFGHALVGREFVEFIKSQPEHLMPVDLRPEPNFSELELLEAIGDAAPRLTRWNKAPAVTELKLSGVESFPISTELAQKLRPLRLDIKIILPNPVLQSNLTEAFGRIGLRRSFPAEVKVIDVDGNPIDSFDHKSKFESFNC